MDTASAHGEAVNNTAEAASNLKESYESALGSEKPQSIVGDDVMKVIAKPDEIPGDPLSGIGGHMDDDILDMDGAYPAKEYTREKLDGLRNPESIQHEGNWDALTESFSRSPSVDAFVPLMTQQSVAQLPAGTTQQLVSVNFPLKVHTSKLYEEGFTNPAMAQSDFSQDQLTQLRTFEDILNKQPSNSSALLNFVEASKEVAQNLKGQFGALWQKPTEQVDIADSDPYKEDKEANLARRFSDDENDTLDDVADEVDDYALSQDQENPEEAYIQELVEKTQM